MLAYHRSTISINDYKVIKNVFLGLNMVAGSINLRLLMSLILFDSCVIKHNYFKVLVGPVLVV
jgi:hypothetical protein